MYQLEFLPIAKNDLDSIIDYISNKLKNKTAAKKLVESFINGANNILQFPYAYSVYNSMGSLKREYRSINVKNFIMFYTINEEERQVTIVRVLYKKMDIDSILE